MASTLKPFDTFSTPPNKISLPFVKKEQNKEQKKPQIPIKNFEELDCVKRVIRFGPSAACPNPYCDCCN
jgi:hypothetical protein